MNTEIIRILSLSDPILIPRIIRLRLKNAWLTRALVRKEDSWAFLQNERINESSSLIHNNVFLIL